MKLSQPIAQLKSDKARIAQKVIREPAHLDELFDGLDADKASLKYGCLKVLNLISEDQPALLYPQFDFFLALLDHPNHIFQWNGLLIVANLARTDSLNKIEAHFRRYFAPILGPVMITAANVMVGAAKIALAKPEQADRIAREIIKVEQAAYQTSECHCIACGHAIRSLAQFFHLIKDQAPVVAFVRKQLQNTRPATRKKAEQFLKKNLERVG